jgi:hypothetical protein
MRLGGLVFLACGAALAGIGLWLLAGVMDWQITADGAGLSTLWLLVTGGVTGVMGAGMLRVGRAPRLMLRLLVVLLAIFVIAGVVVTLQSGARMPLLRL